MNAKLRIIIPLAILAVAGVCYAIWAPVGTLSSFGWKDLAIICPLGALGTMIASQTIIPRAVVSLVIGIVAIFLLGRVFCGWVCPVPVFSKIRGILKKSDNTDVAPVRDFELTAEEKASLKACSHGCGSCAAKGTLDSRHFILVGGLLSTAIFGFPVFCMVCPIGLIFGLVFMIISLFGAGDVTWTIIAVPALLTVELLFFRKWCTHICPLSAFMSLISKASPTFRPSIDNETCLETAKGATCSKCASVCSVGINPRHPELGSDFAECIKCRACVDICPTNSLTLPFLPAKKETATPEPVLAETKE